MQSSWPPSTPVLGTLPSSWYREGTLHRGLIPAFRNSKGTQNALLNLLFLKCLISKQSIHQSMTRSGLFQKPDHTSTRPLTRPQ